MGPTIPSRRRALATLAALLPASQALAAPRRRGDLGLHVEIVVLQATSKRVAGEPDPAVAAIPALTEPPFAAFAGYVVLDKSKTALAQDAPARRALTPGRSVVVTLRRIVAAERFRLAMTIDGPTGRAAPLLDVTTLPGEPVIVAIPGGDPEAPLVVAATVIPRVPLR
jgi:hypothetical protein